LLLLLRPAQAPLERPRVERLPAGFVPVVRTRAALGAGARVAVAARRVVSGAATGARGVGVVRVLGDAGFGAADLAAYPPPCFASFAARSATASSSVIDSALSRSGIVALTSPCFT